MWGYKDDTISIQVQNLLRDVVQWKLSHSCNKPSLQVLYCKLCIYAIFDLICKQFTTEKAAEVYILESYMETITSWQMQICWQISSSVCVSEHIHVCVVTLQHKENNCHWNVTRFHLTSVLCISQATSGCKWRNDCQAHELQLKPLFEDACEAEN